MKTERLLIRKLMPDDWQGMKKIILDFRQSKYAAYDLPMPIEDAGIRDLTRAFAETNLFFAVFLADSAEMIGYVGFHQSGVEYDLGYCFHSVYQGRGYACESGCALLHAIRKEHPECVFTAGTALDNRPSCRLLEKLGFVLVGRETLSFYKDSDGNDIRFEGGQFRLLPEETG